jgi:hypothetical protein
MICFQLRAYSYLSGLHEYTNLPDDFPAFFEPVATRAFVMEISQSPQTFDGAWFFVYPGLETNPAPKNE